MKQIFAGLMLCGTVMGCAQIEPVAETSPVETMETGQMRPVARPSGLSVTAVTPPETAKTVEQFDTTSQEDRKQAEAAAEKAEQSGVGKSLGRTVASLGDPAQPGFWIKTPLVSAAGKGRVVYPANGKTVQVDLIPIDGRKTAGSRMSLAALRVLDAPLTDLPEVEVFVE
ncbi:MAG: hypothetical protein CSA70_05450 [Rhodobacterales bacterium]|nr:MAG: hypothetical protein CSA70_05450 [Rhodobacterales bacterium]